MKSKKLLKTANFFKRTFNFRYWSDYDRLREFSLYLAKVASRLFNPRERLRDVLNAQTVSFDEMAAKLGVTKQQLQRNQEVFYHLSQLMSVVALLIFAYAGYQFFCGNIVSSLVSLMLMLVAWTLAFRYHFWYFQIKGRKLGCTIKEWVRYGLMGDKQ